MLTLVKNKDIYFEYIRTLRLHPENTSGFIEQVFITPAQQRTYMEDHGHKFYIALYKKNPAGYIGVIDNDIRICTDPNFKRKGIAGFMLNNLAVLHPNARAKVLRQNAASNNLFLKCGYYKYNEDKLFNYYKRAGK